MLPRPTDTQGIQRAARWDHYGKLFVERDSQYTLVRLRVDTTGITERHDVVLARFDFDPSDGDGDEYSLTIALDIGDVRRRAANRAYPLGERAVGDSIPAYATVTCFCRPLRPDSVRGTYMMQTRGVRQLAGRIEATLYFTAWSDTTIHATYRLQQRLHGIRP